MLPFEVGYHALFKLGSEVSAIQLAPSLVAAVAVAIAAVSIVAGVSLAVWAERIMPWDAIGVCVAAAGVLLSSQFLQSRSYGSGLLAGLLFIAGTGLSLSFGLAQLLRSTVDSSPAMTAALDVSGFAVMLLAGQALARILVMTQTSGPNVLVLLFGMRRAHRPRPARHPR